MQPNSEKTFRGFNDSMTSGFKSKQEQLQRDTFFPEVSRGDQKSMKDTFTTTWGQVKVIDFKKMAKRDLFPEPIIKDKAMQEEFSSEALKLNTVRSAGWLTTTRNPSKERKTDTLRTAVDFAKQTERGNWLQPYKNHSAGLDYNTIGKGVKSHGGLLVPFDKTLPREQFTDLDVSGSPSTKKKKYFHLGTLKSETQISSLLDFRYMTGRDKQVSLREGHTPLQKSTSESKEPKHYVRREDFHVMDVRQIMAENMRLAR